MKLPLTKCTAWRALHAAVAVLVGCGFSDAAVVTSGKAAESSASRTSLLRAASARSMNALQAAVTVKDSDVTKFGPHNCVSTWVNEDGHCVVATKCKARDLKDYPIKLLCKDNSGQMVRHVFASGSFDPEEEFDTLIRCEKCMADPKAVKFKEVEKADEDEGKKAEQNEKEGSEAEKGKKESSAGEKSSAEEKSSDGEKSSIEENSDAEISRQSLNDLKSQVTELEGFMKKTAAQVKKLNAKVNSDDFQVEDNSATESDAQNATKSDDAQEEDSTSPISPAPAPASPPPMPPPLQKKSLVHQDSVRHRRQPKLYRLSAAKETHRHDEDSDDVYDDASEEDADERARMTLGRSKNADDSEDDDEDGTSEPSSHEEAQKESEFVPADLEAALLQRGGHQAGSPRLEMPRKRDGAFLQRGGHEDDDDDTDEEEDQDAKEKLAAAEEGDESEKSEEDDEMDDDEDKRNSAESNEEDIDTAVDGERAVTDEDENPIEDAVEAWDEDDSD